MVNGAYCDWQNKGKEGARFRRTLRGEAGPGSWMVKKILVAVDGSENSLRAARFAAELIAENREGMLTLIHVVPPVMAALDWYRGPGTVVSEAFEMEKAAAEATAKKAQGMLEEVRLLAEAVARGAELQIDTVVEIGDPARAIVEYAATRGYDIIVVGSRGLNPVKGVFLGSVSYKVLCTAPCPVLVVR